MSAGNDSRTIVIDGIFFQLGRTGIARVWTALLHEWSTEPFAKRLLVLDRGNTVPRFDGIRYRTIPLYDYRTSGDDARRLQMLCDEERAGLFVSTYYTTPLTTPSVFVAYDMIPEVYCHELDSPMWREKHYGVQHASAHVAISHSTARDLARFFPELDVGAIVVAYPGVGATFRPAAVVEIEQWRTQRGLAKPYFLLVGSRNGVNGYKNARLFFEAFAQLPQRRRYAVVCVGGDAVLEPAFQPFVGDAEVHLWDLSDDELRAAYSGAVALAYPSRYEGFGLPVLEAMACGSPVITCRNSSLVEVAGDAALFTPEDEVLAMSAALHRVQEEAERQSLIAAGLQQAARFTWRGMAATLADVFRQTEAAAPRPLRVWSEFRRLQAVAQEHDTLYWELLQTQKDLATVRDDYWKAYWELSEVKEILAHMRASKFWKVRSALVESKKAMLRLAGRWLPRPAA
jgi:glycosyltransferase involved in cell wall biosynthesis